MTAMILVKGLVFLTLAVLPATYNVLGMLLLRGVVILGFLAVWMVTPSWGPWLYVAASLSLALWRLWQLYVKRISMSVYVSSPRVAVQNGSSMWLAIGAILGGVRSLVAGDLTGAISGGLVALLLFGLQGVLSPNQVFILQVCGAAVLSSTEVERLLGNMDYATVLRFNRQARRGGISAQEFARIWRGKGAEHQRR
jgi:hypothetical protein